MSQRFKVPNVYTISRYLVYATVIFLTGLFVYWASGVVSPVIRWMF
ncbi:MAG: hypothetical protein K6B71_02925 [Alphaproteobacteria bacterium]|nr:hypothetical protein [Alphaproteobacteria bacterium]